jgi:hypothetical protein
MIVFYYGNMLLAYGAAWITITNCDSPVASVRQACSVFASFAMAIGWAIAAELSRRNGK